MKKIAVISAHPDDEAFGCAGTILKHKFLGDKIDFLWLTNGIDSRKNISVEDKETRNKEFKSAVEFISPRYYETKKFPDNMLDEVAFLDIVQEIESFLLVSKPDIIYTHFYNDLNIDHKITSRAVMTASRPGSPTFVKEIYAFEVPSSTEWNYTKEQFSPDTYIDVTNFIDRKTKYLKCYSGELRKHPHPRSVENILALSQVRGATVNVEYAESFMTLRRVVLE